MIKNSEYAISSEQSFDANISKDILSLWSTRSEGRLPGKENKKLYWISLTSPSHSKAVVVVNGRVESVLKYQELFYDFYNNGYDVYSYDHRGQGLSERLVNDTDVGHVEEFSDYVEDTASMVKHFNLDKYEKCFLVAHSMGGAIATRYLQNLHLHCFNAIALSAPMYGVKIAWYLKPISVFVMKIKAIFQAIPTYATSNKQYHSKPFEGNPLTKSECRYQWFRRLYEEKPELKVGGPSARWIWQNLTAAKSCIRDTDKLKIPVLLLQASEEDIVSNNDQNQFMNRLKRSNRQANLEVIHGAKHEIFFEKDDYRTIGLTKILSFFDKL